jgi:uncharacterized protein (TIGR00290 family)
MSQRLIISWSSGKDSAWMLHVLRQSGAWDIGALLTTVNEQAERVAMHAVRRALLHAQGRAAGLPVREVPLPWPCTNDEYERRMAAATRQAVADGFTHMAFGDLFLEDVRVYREQKLQGSGLTPVFPLWQRPTDTLARQMISGGLRARLTTVDPRVLDRRFAGREFDAALLEEIGPDVDPCGERGEFHSFAYAGPMFAAPIAIASGDIVERDGFVFADVLPAAEVPA